jgi:hypothetical protein
LLNSVLAEAGEDKDKDGDEERLLATVETTV